MTARGLLHDRRGGSLIEFAMVGMLFSTMLVGTVQVGLLWWLKSGVQFAAASAARCGAIGAKYGTTPCTSASATQTYAVSAAGNWIVRNVVSAADVTVTDASPSCNGVAGGPYVTVTINSSYFSTLPPPLSHVPLSATGCYPSF